MLGTNIFWVCSLIFYDAFMSKVSLAKEPFNMVSVSMDLCDNGQREAADNAVFLKCA